MKFSMKVHQVLLVCCLLALFEGSVGLASTRLSIFMGAEGGSGSIHCHLSPSGSRKFFCKEQCKEDDILIKTDNVTSQRGRYSVAYKQKPSGKDILSVTIRDLTKSDSGRYRCGLGSSSVPESYSDFEVRVSDQLDRTAGFILTSVEGETYRKPCFAAGKGGRSFLCRGSCQTEDDVLIDTEQESSRRGRYGIERAHGSAAGLYVTIEQVAKSDMGTYKCGYGSALSPDSSYTFSVVIIDAPTTFKPDWTLQTFSTSAFEARTSSPSSSGRDSRFPLFSVTPDQPAAAAPTGSAPNQAPGLWTASVLSQGWSLVPGSSSSASVFPEPAAVRSSKPKRTHQPPPTPGLPVSSATTQMLSSGSGSSTPSGFPETTNPPAAAALTTSTLTQTPQPFPTSVPTTSSAATLGLSSTSGRSTPSAFPETTNQPPSAASVTSRPNRTLPPPSTSVPSEISTSGSTPSSVSPETSASIPPTANHASRPRPVSASAATASQSFNVDSGGLTTVSGAATTKPVTATLHAPPPGGILPPGGVPPVAVCLPLAAALLLGASLLLLCKRRKKR